MFGDAPLGIIFLDIILVIFGGVLIPLFWSIFKCLRDILNQSKMFNIQVTDIITKLTRVSEELTEARMRDNNIQNELENVKVNMNRLINGHRKS